TGNYSQIAMVRDLERVATLFDGRRPMLVGAGLGGGTSLLAVGEGFLDAAYWCSSTLRRVSSRTVSSVCSR
ncbi:hypothetical protein ACS2S5_26820, partial [Bacillus cereus group sp. BC48]